MNELMVFEENKVEVFELNDVVYFNPRHVGECLEIKSSAVRMAIKEMNTNQVKKLTNSDVISIDIRKLNNAGENFLTESGVYELIFNSRKPASKRFRCWVTDEVLPTIRKTGGYLNPEIDWTDLDQIQKVLDVAKEERQKRLKAEKIIQEQKPKVEYYNNVLDTDSSYTTTQIAKELEMTAKQLNIILQQENIQFKQSGQWLLKKEYQNQGLVKTRTYLFKNNKNENKTTHNTVWTEKGRTFIKDLMENI